jgi:hypothetical protein
LNAGVLRRYSVGLQGHVMTSGTAQRRENRRLTARRACLLIVRYRLDKHWHPATVLNLSATGCRLRLGQDLPLNTAVSVLFETPLQDGATAASAEVQGTVTWSRLEGLSHQVGIQFSSDARPVERLLSAIG